MAGPEARASDRSKLVRRLVTAAVLVPPVLALLWAGGLYSAALIAAAAGIAAWEFIRLTLPEGPKERWAAIAGSAALPLLPAIAGRGAPAIALGIVTAVSGVAWGWHVVRGEIGKGAGHAPALVSGIAFTGISLFWLAAIRARADGFAWTVTVLAATWVNDAAAFFGGRTFGRHKLAPQVSPGKSWEGALFGVLGAAAASASCAWVFAPALRAWDAAAMAAIASVAGPLGDLMKSLVKRARGVKDAGGLFPGHGGMLDRIDAVLVNAPLAALYLALAHPAG